MSANNDRFWDTAIAEAATGRTPPDQSAEILARLNAPDARPADAPRPLLRRIGWHALHTTVAVTVLLAIGLATGVVPWPWSEAVKLPDPPKQFKNLIAADGAKWNEADSAVVLESGALLASTGAPEVRRHGSTFKVIDGLALVSAGAAPDGADEKALKDWLSTKGVDDPMIHNATKWLTGAGLAVLMLNGSATLDGQKVEAEKPVPVQWTRVQSAMDIDKLPPEVKYVETANLAGAYLPLLAAVKRLEGIRFIGGHGITAEDVETLQALPNLQMLYLRRSRWAKDADYAPLRKLARLKSIGLDLTARPPRPGDPNSDDGKAHEVEAIRGLDAQLAELKQLRERGVRVDFGVTSSATRFLDRVHATFPDVEELDLARGTDWVCKQAAMFTSLRRLNLGTMGASELGYIELAKLTKLEELSIDLESGMSMRPEFVHHLAKIKSLTTLRLATADMQQPQRGVITILGTMTQLRTLSLDMSYWPLVARLDGAVTSPLAALKQLDRFQIDVPPGIYQGTAGAAGATQGEYIKGNSLRHPLDLGFIVGAKTVLVRATDSRLAQTASEIGGQAHDESAARVEVIRFLPFFEPSAHGGMWIEKWATALKRYPNLKRVEVGAASMFDERDEQALLDVELGKAARDLAEALPGVEVVEVANK